MKNNKKFIFLIVVTILSLQLTDCDFQKITSGFSRSPRNPDDTVEEYVHPEAAEEEEPASVENTIYGHDYIFPDSDSRYLTVDELNSVDNNVRQMAINEIYARQVFNLPLRQV